VAKDNKNYLIPVVVGTFDVLGELSRAGPLNIADLAHRTKVAKSTVFRILNTLHHLGYLWRDAESRTYSLSPRLSELARDVDWGTAMLRIALPHMTRLRAEIGETVNLARLDFDRVIYLEVVESEHALRMCERKGGWDHAHASALGKAILAFSPPNVVDAFLDAGALPALTSRTLTDPQLLREELQKIRRRGYSLEREESRKDASCIGAPILDVDGLAIAGLSISGPVSRFNPSKDKNVPTALMEAARQISIALAEEIGRPASPKKSLRSA